MATAMTNYTSKLVKSGAIEGFSGKYVRLYVAYKSIQDAATNQSTLYLGMYITSDGIEIGRWGDWNGSYIGNSSTTFDGTVPASTVATASSPYWLVSNKKFTIKHSASGTASATIAWKWGVNSTWGGMVIPSGNFTITLPTIPRASTISATNCYIRDASTITITRASSTFKHTLKYKITGQSDYTTIVSKTSATSYKFDTSKIAETALNLIPNTVKSVNCSIQCITYDSAGKQVGNATTDTIKLTGKDSDLKPVLNPEIEDSNQTIVNLTGNKNIIVKYYSKPYFALWTEYPYDSQPKSFKVVNGSKTFTTDSGVFSDGVESNVFTFSMTDSRGYTVSKTITLEKGIRFIEANKPTITMATTSPVLITENDKTTFTFNLNLKGSCFNGSLGATTAETRIYYRYKVVNTNTWLGENQSTSAGWIMMCDSTAASGAGFNDKKTSYNVSTDITGLDYTKAYIIQGRIYNTLESINTAEQTKKATPVFEWSETDFQFNVPVKMTNSNYYSQSNKTGGGLDLNNSDIVGLNGLYFADAADSGGEGLFFYNSSTKAWDVLYAHQGKLYFKPDYSNNTTAYKMCITPGDTITLANNCALHGFISNGRKSILLTIPLNKPVVGVSGATLKGTLQMRGVGGYIYNQASNKTEKTATFVATASKHSAEGITSSGIQLTGQSLMISFTFNAALTHNAAGTTATTNNSPIIVVPDGNFTITFT